MILAALLTLGIAIFFWTQSRYPALDEKAAMGAATPVAGIAFDMVVELLPNSSLAWELAGNTINWMYTNWKGMTFGVLFGGCMLTLLGLVERRGFDNRFANAALGAAIGTPLGVCVNCAAPIARGLHSAGMRLETTLSALVSSPTLNVIVVSMAFALLPIHMAVVKLVFALGFVLLGVPVMSKLLFAKEASQVRDSEILELQAGEKQSRLLRMMERLRPPPRPESDFDTWLKAARWLVEAFARNLAFIAMVTVPLMILAGVLGAIAITLLPFDSFGAVMFEPSGYLGKLLLLIAVAAVAIFLPVPIAFDVILASILIGLGWPVLYVMTLMVALGSFSIYSYLIVGRAISFRVATSLMAGLAAMAVAAGIVVHYLDYEVQAQADAANIAYLADARLDAPPSPADAGVALASVAAPAIDYVPLQATYSSDGPGQVSAVISPVMTGQAAAAGAPAFARLAGPDIGLSMAPYLNGLEALEPFMMYWAVAAGDLQGDGWSDIAMARPAAEGGLTVFANTGGTFVPLAMDFGPVQQAFVSNLRFVDLDNDGDDDLFVATFQHGTFVFWNDGGKFDFANRAELANGDAGMVGAPGFADLDGDGRQDILAANWSLGTVANNHNPYLLISRDRVFWNEGDGRFTAQELDGIPGESLTSLITDVNGDGLPDLMIGDDVSSADKIYFNRGDRRFELMRGDANLVPYLTKTSMSIDAGDLDNDLDDELYLGQIAFGRRPNDQFTPSVSYCPLGSGVDDDAMTCFMRIAARTDALQMAHPLYSECAELTDPTYRAICAARSVMLRSGYLGQSEHCDDIAAMSPELAGMCRMAAGERYPDAEAEIARQGYPGGLGRRNLLLVRNAEGSFDDRSAEFGMELPGWTWNARMVDLDQDGWQDVFVATGYLAHRSFLPNRYYHNDGGTGFTQLEEEAGLADPYPAATYSLVDYDRDGDLDIIRPSAMSQPIIHRNDAVAGRGLWVRLEDGIGNREGVGARIVITAASGQQQVREVRQSGGFGSGDRPMAHFGLGSQAEVVRIEVRWQDGSRSTIRGSIPAGTEVVIRRSAGA